MTKGIFIVIEGIDGCGKTTQVRLMESWLRKQGVNVSIYQFPSRDSSLGIFETLNKDLQGEKAISDPYARYLLYSADRYSKQMQIKSDLDKGFVVLCDRYVASGCVYGNVCHGVPLEWAVNVEKYLIRPDLTVQLYMENVSSALSRNRKCSAKKQGPYDTLDTQIKLLQGFMDYFIRFDQNVLTVNISDSMKESAVADVILRALNDKFKWIPPC